MSRLGLVSRCLSLLIAGIYVALCLTLEGPKAAPACLILALPLALIWFPEELGAMTGYLAHGPITAETPPILVAIMGWLFLLSPALLPLVG